MTVLAASPVRWPPRAPAGVVTRRRRRAWAAVALLWASSLAAAAQAQGAETPALPHAATAVQDADRLAVAGLAAAAAGCAGKPIAVAELLGCVGTRCQDRDERESLLSLADLLPGRVLVAGALERAVARLHQTGFFHVESVACTLGVSGARLRVRVRGTTVIRHVRIEGNRELFSSELRNKLLFQPGDVLEPDTVEGKALIARQQAAIETVYQRAGFERAKVTLRTEPFAVGQITVTLVVDEGMRDRVAAVRVKILDPHQPTAQERAADLRCERVRDRAVLQASDLGEIDVFTRRAGVKARTRIRELLRRLGYHAPRVAVEHDRRDNTVEIELRLGRCSEIRVLVRESSELATRDAAYRALEDDSLLEALPFVESGVFDIAEAERGRRELRAVLENRGFLFANVDLDFRETPRAWGSRVASVITYRVTTQYIAQIRGLRVCDASKAEAHEGREGGGCAVTAGEGLAFPEATLRKVIQTKSYDFLDEGGFLSTARMFGDLEALRQFYRDNGYFEFRFGRTAPAGPLGIVRQRRRTGTAEIIEYLLADRGFVVRRPIGEQFIYVDVPVEEGRRARYADVAVDGISGEHRDEVLRLLGSARGDVVSYRLLVDAVRRVEEYYHNIGHFQANVTVLCRARGRGVDAQGGDDFAPCTARSILAEQVWLRAKVHEGPRVKIGEVFVTGNFRTATELILRDMPASGTDFSAATLFSSLRALRNLGLFRSVSFQYLGRDEAPPREKIGILVRVVEEESRYAELAAGFQTVNVNRADNSGLGTTVPGLVDIVEHITASGARLGVGYGQRLGVNLPNLLFTVEGNLVERNLDIFGGGKELRLVGRAGITPSLATTGPALVLAALVYQDRRLFGSEVGLRLFPAYFSRDFATSVIDLDKAGTAAEVSRAFGRLALSLGAEGGFVRFRTTSDEPLSAWQVQYKLLPRLSLDALDSPLNPSRGLYLGVASALINAVIENSTASTAERGTFAKFEAQGKALWTLRETLTVGLTLRAGWVVGLDNEIGGRLPGNERFRLGGQLGLRGYADNGVLQYDGNGWPLSDCVEQQSDGSCARWLVRSDGDVVVNGSLEARFPLLRAKNWWGALFWDWGGIAERWEEFDGAAVRHGVGFGLRYLVSGQIPIRADYGIALGRRCATPQPPPAATCAERDAFGRLHLGLLYSF